MNGVEVSRDAVGECDACDDHRQAVFTLELSPGLGSRHDKLGDNEPWVFGVVFFLEDGDGGFSAWPIRRVADLTQIGLHIRLHRFRNLVENVRDLVDPAALMLC